MLLLFLATVLGQLPSSGAVASPSAAPAAAASEDEGLSSALAVGFFICLVYAALSAFAGVFTEALLKNSAQSIHLQNLEIYSWSALIALYYAWNSGVDVFSVRRLAVCFGILAFMCMYWC